jgi:hypothetical protein
MSQSLPNKSRLLEKYTEVVRQDGLITNKNVNIGINGNTSALWVGGNISSGGTIQGGVLVPTIQSALVGATVVLTAAQSGGVFQNRSTSGSPSWTLPTAANGLEYTFTTANTTAGFTVTGGTIHAKTSATGTAVSGTTLTNTQATAVVGDSITLVCDGTAWWVTAQTGIFTAA